MKAAVIYISVHHQNTKKIASAISEELGADLFEISEVTPDLVKQYGLIGFGSGIFYGKHHERIFKFIDNISLKGKNVFIFSTSGTGSEKCNKSLGDALLSKKANIRGSFSCKGYDTYGVFKWIGGVAKGRPDSRDIESAREFARALKESLE